MYIQITEFMRNLARSLILNHDVLQQTSNLGSIVVSLYNHSFMFRTKISFFFKFYFFSVGFVYQLRYIRDYRYTIYEKCVLKEENRTRFSYTCS